MNSQSQCRWYSKIVSKRPRFPGTHSKAGTDRKDRKFHKRTSMWTGRVSTDRINRSHWSPCRLLVDPKWLHLSSSQWTSSSTLCAQRNIPYSTEIHWCNKIYSYWSGRHAREKYRWLLERRFEQKLVKFVERFHKFHYIKEKPHKWYMWFGWRFTNIQSTTRPDHLWPDVWTKIGKAARESRNIRMEKREAKTQQCSKTERNLLYWSSWPRLQRNPSKCEEKIGKTYGGIHAVQKGKLKLAPRKWMESRKLHPKRVPKRFMVV